MIQIEDLQLAVALSKSPSLSAAARMLNVTPSALSMRLRKLEAKLGLSLASRTARHLSLTPEGERFSQEAHALLMQLEALPETLLRDDRSLTGTLRVAAPFGYGRDRVAPMLANFAKLHPRLKVQLDLRESPWTDRQDADAVIHIGTIRDSSWVGRTLARNERWLCASPAYLQQHGIPQTPRDLLDHACICIRENDEDMTLWSFRHTKSDTPERSGTRQSLRIEPALLTNDGSTARYWAERDLGIVLRSEWDVSGSIARGTLVRVLAEWEFDHAPVMLLVPTRKGRTARVDALLRFFEDILHVD